MLANQKDAVLLPLVPTLAVSLRFACVRQRAQEPVLRVVRAAVLGVWAERELSP